MTSERPDVVSTYRMLRLALAALAFAILLAAAVQSVSQGCLLTSISAYRYTDASVVFVAGLVAIGVCLVALRGGTWTENLLLNLAGMLAPIVAIVPTPLSGDADVGCLLQPVPGSNDRSFLVFANPVTSGVVDNALITYLVIALLGYVVALVSARRVREVSTPLPRAARGARVLGFVVAGGGLVAVAAWRLLDGDGFLAAAHTGAAIAMFACIALVVAFRTRPLAGLSRRWDAYRDDSVDAAMSSRRASSFSMAYGVIATVMVLSVVGAFVVLAAWDYRLILAETLLLVSFIVFWLLQTWQLAEVES